MSSKVKLTKDQLETILKLINDINLEKDTTDSLHVSMQKWLNRSDVKNFENIEKKKKKSSFLKKRSYSAIDLKNSKNEVNLFPEIKKINKKNLNVQKNDKNNDQIIKRNKSLIDLKREKWDREKLDLIESDCWYEKFDSFKNKKIDRCKSQPNLDENRKLNSNFQSISRVISPISFSQFDTESIALSNFTASSTPFLQNENFLSNQKSHRRFAHNFNDIDIVEKKRKQQEYQAQLKAQVLQKKQIEEEKKNLEFKNEKKLNVNLLSNENELNKYFGTNEEDKFEKSNFKFKNTFEDIKLKSKDLKKLFKEAWTQTDNLENNKISIDKTNTNLHFKMDTSTQTSELLMNKWLSMSSLQPIVVKRNRSALLKNSTSYSKPKWTKKLNIDDDSSSKKLIVLPKLDQKKNHFVSRKQWNL